MANSKKCKICEKSRPYSSFYKSNNATLFPDGYIDICGTCIKETVNPDDLKQVINFLRQIDKPFLEKEWTVCLENRHNKFPVGAYVAKINSLKKYRDMNFKDSDGFDKSTATIDLTSARESNEVTTVDGKTIVYSENLINKWGVGYSKTEYLQMEKFFQDMKATHEIFTPTHYDMLKQLAYLSVDRDKLRKERDWNNYSKISKTYDDIMRSAGFRPIDKQGIEDATGLRSFSQIWEEVEKRGFIKPPPPKFEEDIVDQMIISLANYYHRLIGKEILSEIPDEIKQEMEDFYKEDLTPEEIEDDYEDFVDTDIDE